jgi:hypothetical protein
MSKKRKRHENGQETTPTNKISPSIPELQSTEPEETSQNKILTAEETKHVQKKVFHGVKEMTRTFKKARDFETRKIIKRLKSAK